MPNPNIAITPVNNLDGVGNSVVDSGDPRSWWQKVTDGWNDFWSKVGQSIDQNHQANVGITNPYGTLEGVGASQAEPVSSTDLAGSSTDTESIDTAFEDALDGGVSVSDYMRNNPDASIEDVFKFMASQSDEWAEKYMDYVLEKQSIQEQNDYTANREDTAYQRLVEDLKKAGLNPALMYGSSASTSASGSVGVVKASEGANTRTLSNYDKLKRLILAYMTYQVGVADKAINGSTKLFEAILRMF